VSGPHHHRVFHLLRLMRYYDGGAPSRSIVVYEARNAERAGEPPDPTRDGLYEQYAGPYGELTRVIERMERDVQRAHKGGRLTEDKEDRNARIITEYVGWAAGKVAVFEDLSVTQVREIRRMAGVAAKDGREHEAA
jgi:hypothetical protein